MADMTPTSKSQIAYQWLSDRILTREFTPGYRLVLQVVADRLGMSVVPVREAMRRLEAEGLVTFQRNIGASVAMIDPHEYEHVMSVLAVLEGAATALAAPLLTTDDLARARAVNDRMAVLLADFDARRFTELNRTFHTIVFERCPNPELLDLVQRSWVRLAGLRDSSFTYIPHRARESVTEHAELLDLIARGADALDVELAARNHRDATRRAWLAARAAALSRSTRAHSQEN